MKQNREGDCSSCPERFLCKELCPGAELYVNQDFVKMREMPRGLIRPRKFPQIDGKINLTKTEFKIVKLLAVGLSPSEVSELLEIKRNAVYQHVDRIKKKYLKI